MDRRIARDRLRECLEAYLIEKGLNPRRPFCCLNPDHDDCNPSMSFDRLRNRVHCFSCGVSYDIIDLIALDRHCTISEAFKFGYAFFRINVDSDVSHFIKDKQDKSITFLKKEVPSSKIVNNNSFDFSSYLDECSRRMSSIDYLQVVRGLSDEVVSRFHIGYDPNFMWGTGEDSWKAIIIPTGDGRTSFTARNVDVNAVGNNRIRKRGGAGLFNPEVLLVGHPVFVVEGEIDALSVIDVGGAAVALGSTTNVEAFARYLRDNNVKPDYPLLLALDNDEEGNKATKKLVLALASLGIRCKIVDIVGQFKDANEALVFDRESFAKTVKALIQDETDAGLRSVEAFNVVNIFSSFIAEVSRRHDDPAISTGFMKLDSVLSGGLTAGIYVIGAIPSIGKTAFVLQMTDQIAMQGRDVIYFSLEMSKYELIARSISRETYQRARGTETEIRTLARPHQCILNGKVYDRSNGVYWEFNEAQKKHIKECSDAYLRYASHIYILEGVGGYGISRIDNFVSEFILHKGTRPVVVIDYLQLLEPADPKSNDKQNMDVVVLTLKRFSREYGLPVVLVSSFNRQSYSRAVSMESFKESGSIEYTADVLIGLQYPGMGVGFDINSAKGAYPRDIEAVILKNRNGASGQSIPFKFLSGNNTFLDEEEYTARHRDDAQRLDRMQQAKEEKSRKMTIAAEHARLQRRLDIALDSGIQSVIDYSVKALKDFEIEHNLSTNDSQVG